MSASLRRVRAVDRCDQHHGKSRHLTLGRCSRQNSGNIPWSHTQGCWGALRVRVANFRHVTSALAWNWRLGRQGEPHVYLSIDSTSDDWGKPVGIRSVINFTLQLSDFPSPIRPVGPYSTKLHEAMSHRPEQAVHGSGFVSRFNAETALLSFRTTACSLLFHRHAICRSVKAKSRSTIPVDSTRSFTLLGGEVCR